MKQFKLIPLAVLASLTMSSCDDVLTKDSEDTVTTEQYLSNDQNLLSFTYHLYGPYTWTNYESKFAWCANELTVGNVYHNYGDEGEFFFLSFGEGNAQLLNGYQALYGLISRCNMIINELEGQCGPGVSPMARERAKGEAYLFRGYAYYLLTEYWGESYIVTNNSNIIVSDAAFNVPKADRACMYAQAEKDLTMAARMLPDNRWGNKGERPSKAAAHGMLGKLYLTMAAATTNDGDCQYKFNVPAGESFDSYNKKAIEHINVALGGAYLESGANYENIFWPKTYNPENLFSLYFEEGPYGAGAQRQIMFARSKYMDGGDDYYGGEKGLTVTLFKSFEQNDVRKKACCYYTDAVMDADPNRKPMYKMYADPDYAYYYNPNKTLVNSPYGSEPESPCLNAVRKFVYGMHLTNKFSAPLTFPILRTADLYLMRAEANLALETGAVAVWTPSKDKKVLDDINVVRVRAGVPEKKDIAVALYDTDPRVSTTFVDDRDPSAPKTYGPYDTYSDTYDLFEERRHEFALECQNWLDLKRIYYRNAGSGNEFLKHQDRGWTYGQRLGIEDFAKGETQYQRTKELHMADESLPDEKAINLENVKWFFPIPAAVKSTANNGPLYTNAESISNGTYPY